MTETKTQREIKEFTVLITQRATQLRNLSPDHSLLVWHTKLWEVKNIGAMTLRLRTRTFVHRFIKDKSFRANFLTDDSVQLTTLVEYTGELEDALAKVTQLVEEGVDA